MLVLSRKSQEKIQIGDQITISVLAVKGNVVRIGIEAPTNIHIVRGELPPLEKTAKSKEQETATLDASGSNSAPAVQSVRVCMHRYPALQSRLNRRLDVLKSDACTTK